MRFISNKGGIVLYKTIYQLNKYNKIKQEKQTNTINLT